MLKITAAARQITHHCHNTSGTDLHGNIVPLYQDCLWKNKHFCTTPTIEYKSRLVVIFYYLKWNQTVLECWSCIWQTKHFDLKVACTSSLHETYSYLWATQFVIMRHSFRVTLEHIWLSVYCNYVLRENAILLIATSTHSEHSENDHTSGLTEVSYVNRRQF